MKMLKTMIVEVLGLFVDDGSLAIAILVVVAATASIATRLANFPIAVGAILVIGCLAVLAENVVRTARKYRRATKPAPSSQP